MPSHKIHKWFNKLLTGDEHEDVNRFCDLVRGRNHRRKWGHDAYTPVLVYLLSKDPNKALAAMGHIALDKLEKRLKYGKR